MTLPAGSQQGGHVSGAERTSSNVGHEALSGQAGGRKRGGKGKRRDEHQMVPDATFTSYYGRPIVKASPWAKDIPAYLFLGGLAAGSSLLGAGGDLSGRPGLRRGGRVAAFAGISVSFVALVHDLGRPERFYNMLRVAKPTSPMSVGTWILTVYGPLAGLAGAAELRYLLPRKLALVGRLLGLGARPAGLVAAVIAPAVASYTAVLLTDTATPTWHDARNHLPFVFVGSASSAAGGLAMATVPLAQSGPARRLAIGGAVLELAVERKMEQAMGLTAEPLHHGSAGKLMLSGKVLTGAGAVGATLFGRRSRVAAALSGTALVIASACTRFGVFEAGQESAKDPKYVVVPQRARVEARERLGTAQGGSNGSATSSNRSTA